MNLEEQTFIETPLATPLHKLRNRRRGRWRAQWRRWRFTQRKASKLHYEEIDDVLQQSEWRVGA